MTRINADVEPSKLTDQHLFAEYREIRHVPGSLRRSLKAVNYDVNKLKEKIPHKFTLNKGHVTFWYDKQLFLYNRFKRLRDELIIRGYDLPANVEYDILDVPQMLLGNYIMDDIDFEIIQNRINERINEKPEWYRYYGVKITESDKYQSL